MLFQTHILIGITFFLFFDHFFDPTNPLVFLFLLLFGSLLPDIDERHSKIHRWSGAIGSVITFFSKHRGFFHSLLFHVLLFLMIAFFFKIDYALPLLLGYFSHLVGDGLTPAGVMIFYPFSEFKISGPIKVGSFLEFFLMIGLLVLIIWQFF